jgi:hypothetical protein
VFGSVLPLTTLALVLEYHARFILSRLGDELIAVGDGWIAARIIRICNEMQGIAYLRISRPTFSSPEN